MDPQERIQRYLDDAIAMESGLIPALKDMASEATTDEDRHFFEQHVTRTQQQHDRLVARLQALGGHPTAVKGMINKLGVMGHEAVNMLRDKEEKAVRNLITAYGSEHVEIASYLALETAARAIGDTETASLAQEIRKEEEHAASMIHTRLLALPATAMHPVTT